MNDTPHSSHDISLPIGSQRNAPYFVPRYMVVVFVLLCVNLWMAWGLISNAAKPQKKTSINSTFTPISAYRKNIVDREGRILANNIPANALYAHPHKLIAPASTVEKLKEIFPNIKPRALADLLNGKKKYVPLLDTISYAQKQAVNDIGDPGLNFARREVRFYPKGQLAGHILGGSRFGKRDVRSAEILGSAGVERYFDALLRTPTAESTPLALSLDVRVQDVLEHLLEGGMRLNGAKGAAAVVMDIHSGEIIALASMPDFNPNWGMYEMHPPERLFNQAVQGVYEFGSVFKLFTVAQALEEGRVSSETQIDIGAPLYIGKYEVKDYRYLGESLTVRDILIRSSNIGAAQIALGGDKEDQRDFLRRLGLLESAPLELGEARAVRPLYARGWPKAYATSVAYGYGLSVSLVHLASAYASVLNGGKIVRPTLLKSASAPDLGRIVRTEVSEELRHILRANVTEGTARLAKDGYYRVAGKTGTANKVSPKGGYDKTRTIATFASVFPATQPEYVLVTMLNEPHYKVGDEIRRTAGSTAVPLGASIIERIAPLLGVRAPLP